MADNQHENEFEASQRSKMNIARCLMTNGFTACCGICMMYSAMGNPPDARKLSEEEAKPYMEGLQGGPVIYQALIQDKVYHIIRWLDLV